jgi:hypothetical protein
VRKSIKTHDNPLDPLASAITPIKMAPKIPPKSNAIEKRADSSELKFAVDNKID